MKIKNKILHIFLNTIPVIVMIALIPVWNNDYILTGIYVRNLNFKLKIFPVSYEPTMAQHPRLYCWHPGCRLNVTSGDQKPKN